LLQRVLFLAIKELFSDENKIKKKERKKQNLLRGAPFNRYNDSY